MWRLIVSKSRSTKVEKGDFALTVPKKVRVWAPAELARSSASSWAVSYYSPFRKTA